MTDRPREYDELTPEQHAALVELGRKLAEYMQEISDAFATFITACAAAQRAIEAMPDLKNPDPGDSP